MGNLTKRDWGKLGGKKEKKWDLCQRSLLAKFSVYVAGKKVQQEGYLTSCIEDLEGQLLLVQLYIFHVRILNCWVVGVLRPQNSVCF